MYTVALFVCLFLILLTLWGFPEKNARKSRKTATSVNRTEKPRIHTARKPNSSANNKLADSFRLRKGTITPEQYREKWG